VVGGAVRDLLLGRVPKDFDVATDATPDQVRALFRRSRVIGRRFQHRPRLLRPGHHRGDHLPRPQHLQGDAEDDDDRVTAADGMLLRDNVFGGQEDDAARRDFTVNALYYDTGQRKRSGTITAASATRAKRRLKMIGDPATRYREDPVRMLRAARFAAKLEFQHRPGDARAHRRTGATMLERIPLGAPVRRDDETADVRPCGARRPATARRRAAPRRPAHARPHPRRRRRASASCTPPCTTPTNASATATRRRPRSCSPACSGSTCKPTWRQRQAERPAVRKPRLFDAMDDTLERQRERLWPFPRRMDGMIKEIWALQPRFEQRSGARPFRLLTHPRFRAGYDFLLLRARGGDAAEELADWWTRFQDAPEHERSDMLVESDRTAGKRRRPRRRRDRSGGDGADEGGAPATE
jgi:poly(A) polymerase